MPASPRALRSYLEQTRGVDPAWPGYLNDFGKTVHELLSQAYLSSGRRAALYDLMAQTPGFTLVPDAADGIGRHGVGIALSLPDGGGKTVIIFDSKTYTELSLTTRDAQGQQGTGALLKLAIVNKAGQLPRPRAGEQGREAHSPLPHSFLVGAPSRPMEPGWRYS